MGNCKLQSLLLLLLVYHNCQGGEIWNVRCLLPGLVVGLKYLDSEDSWCARVWWYPTTPHRNWSLSTLVRSPPFLHLVNFANTIAYFINSQHIFCMLSWYFHISYPLSLTIMFLLLLLFSVICTLRDFMVVFFWERESSNVKYFALFWFQVDLLDSRDSWLQKTLTDIKSAGQIICWLCHLPNALPCIFLLNLWIILSNI